jgi:hypothetical protein
MATHTPWGCTCLHSWIAFERHEDRWSPPKAASKMIMMRTIASCIPLYGSFPQFQTFFWSVQTESELVGIYDSGWLGGVLRGHGRLEPALIFNRMVSQLLWTSPSNSSFGQIKHPSPAIPAFCRLQLMRQSSRVVILNKTTHVWLRGSIVIKRYVDGNVKKAVRLKATSNSARDLRPIFVF